MFGNAPRLKPAELIYQRMLARDLVEAAEQARAFYDNNSGRREWMEQLRVGIRLDEAGIDCKAFAADHALFMQRSRTVSKTRRRRSLLRKRPCRSLRRWNDRAHRRRARAGRTICRPD